MFAKTIIGSDAFLDMPQSTQALYFHLAMRADDDGFVNSPKSIMRLVGCKDDDLKVLCSKKFVIPFDSGIVVIKHWRIHNYIAKDRYTETKYKNEKAHLGIDENGSYTDCIQLVDECETQVRLGEVREGKGRREEERASAQEPPPISKNPDLKIIPRPGLSTALGSEIVEAWRIMPEAIPKPYGAAGMELLSDDLRRALEAIRSKRITSGDALECIKNYRATANGEAGETWVKIWLGLAKFFETDFWQNFLPNRWPDAVKKLQEKPKPEIDWTELEKEAKRLEGLK
jgi:hypothetical protein